MTPNYWMLVSTLANFEVSRERGFDLAAMKSRHRRKAEKVRPGDKLVFYLKGLKVLGGTAEVTSFYFEESTPIWFCSPKRAHEKYPFRFSIVPELICPADAFLPVDPFHHEWCYLKKWPAEYWHLGFQGNVHLLPEADFLLITGRLKEHLAALRESGS